MKICHDQRNGTGCGSTNADSAQRCGQCGRPLNYALRLLNPGSSVNGYQIIRTIGHGGFGAVYEAQNIIPDPSTVALKETFNTDFITSFQGEFAVLRHLHHDNLPQYYATFVADENGYLVMELIPGQSLQEIQAQTSGRPLRESQVLGYAVQLCGVLTYLHRQSPPIIHRDIKPDNIRLTPDGLIKLVDFGLLKQGTGTTASSRRGLTLAYAPIEQYGGQAEGTDARSDIYSLGATLYHLLTGQPPLPSTQRLAANDDPLPTPQTINPRITPHVSQAIMTAMALTRDRRFPSADAFAQALMGRASATQIVSTPPRPASDSIPPTQVIMATPYQPQVQAPMQQAAPQPMPRPVTNSPTVAWTDPAAGPIPQRPTARQRLAEFQKPLLFMLLLVVVLVGAGLVWTFMQNQSANSGTVGQGDPAGQTLTTPASNDAAIIPADTSNSNANGAPLGSGAITSLDATATAINATQIALAVVEQTAVAREQEAAVSGTSVALRQTEQAVMQTVAAVDAAQTARARPASPDPGGQPFGGSGGSSGDVCDRATVVGSSIAQLAINTDPSTSSVQVGAVSVGNSVEVLCRDTTTSDGRLWVWVRYQGVEGWMSTRYLEFANQFPAPVCGIGTVVGSDISFLAINVETLRGSTQRGEVPVGGQVEVLCVPEISADERIWVMVRYQGIEGWMSTRYLDIR